MNEAEREAFEKQYKHLAMDKERSFGGERYIFPMVEALWEGWLARARTTAIPPALSDEPTKVATDYAGATSLGRALYELRECVAELEALQHYPHPEGIAGADRFAIRLQFARAILAASLPRESAEKIQGHPTERAGEAVQRPADVDRAGRKAESLRDIATRVVADVTVGHDWPNTDAELDRINAAYFLREYADRLTETQRS